MKVVYKKCMKEDILNNYAEKAKSRAKDFDIEKIIKEWGKILEVLK